MYHISDDQMAYLDAVAFCEGLGGILAEPRSPAQQEEINGVLDPDYEYWIGLDILVLKFMSSVIQFSLKV